MDESVGLTVTTPSFDDIFSKEPDIVRDVLERTWFRNILYWLGEQYINWFTSPSAFGYRYSIAGSVPTPVSNMVRDHVRSISALTMNKSYTTRVWPNSAELKDKDGAKAGERLLRSMDADGVLEDIKESVEWWRHLTGSGFCRTYPGVNPGKYTANANGEPLSQDEIRTECTIPFNVHVPLLGQFLPDKKYVGIISLADREWVEDTYGVELTGGDKHIGEIDYQRQLMVLVANVSPWKGRGLDAGDIEEKHAKEMVVLKEVEWKPTAKHPKGLYICRCEDKELTKKGGADLPIPVSKEGKWHYTLTHFAYNRMGGGFWPSGSVDDIISPQNTVNEIDQGLSINRKSLGRPYLLTPTEMIMKRVSLRGQALLHIQYDSRLSGGAKPEIRHGTPYPQQVLEERKNQRSVIQDAGGDPKNVLRGASPHSGASGYMVDVLRETAEMSHTPDIKRFYRAWQRVRRKQLILAQRLFKESRILKEVGEGNEIIVSTFKGADLHGNVDVRLEPGSGMATTQAGQNEFFLRLTEAQFFGDITVQPMLQRALLTKFGLGDLPAESSIHRDRAERENSILASGDTSLVERVALPGGGGFPQTFDPLFKMDPHDVHIQVMDEFMFGAEFHALSSKIQAWFIGHREMHLAVMAAQIAAVQAEQVGQMEGAEAEAGAEQGPAPTPVG